MLLSGIGIGLLLGLLIYIKFLIKRKDTHRNYIVDLSIYDSNTTDRARGKVLLLDMNGADNASKYARSKMTELFNSDTILVYSDNVAELSTDFILLQGVDYATSKFNDGSEESEAGYNEGEKEQEPPLPQMQESREV